MPGPSTACQEHVSGAQQSLCPSGMKQHALGSGLLPVSERAPASDVPEQLSSRCSSTVTGRERRQAAHQLHSAETVLTGNPAATGCALETWGQKK